MRTRNVLAAVIATAFTLCGCGGGGADRGLRYRIDDARMSGIPAEERSPALAAQTEFIKAQERYRNAHAHVAESKKELEQATTAHRSAEAKLESARKARDSAREKGDAARKNETSRKAHIAELELRAAALRLEFATAQIEVAQIQAEAAEAEMFAMEARFEEQKALLLRGKNVGEHRYQDFELQREQRVGTAELARQKADQHQGDLDEKKRAWQTAVREAGSAAGNN